tara:strand:- start:1353 stop:2615 length:1263 start_codon:yes stop_codon:yes gene_type:complete
MQLFLVGINHNTASVDIREKIAFSEEELIPALKSLKDSLALEEIAILSTCNRTEIYVISETSESESIKYCLANLKKIEYNKIRDSFYVKSSSEVANHALKVASGLDSLILGESQVLGQFKNCFHVAGLAGTLGRELKNFSQIIFRGAKAIRSQTKIGENSVSLGSLTVTIAEKLFAQLSTCRVMLVGAGEIAQLVGKHLKSAGISQFTIANRSKTRGDELAKLLGGRSISIDTANAELLRTDILVASTSSSLPVIGKGSVESALKNQKHKPILMVDLAIPRDIEPETGELGDIYLYSLDDFQKIIDKNLNIKEKAASDAREIVAFYANQYKPQEAISESSKILRDFRNAHNLIKDEEVLKAIANLNKGDEPREVIIQLANQLTNKIMHEPTVKIKNALDWNNQTLIEAAVELYDLGKKDE